MLDNVNEQIIRILQANGRATNREIARRIGVSEGTVRNRIERMTREGIIRVAAIVNPGKMGLQTTAVIFLQVEPRHLATVSERLSSVGQLTYIGYATGQADVICLGHFFDNDALFRFITDVVAQVPGIHRIETSIVLHSVRPLFSSPENVEGEFAPFWIDAQRDRAGRPNGGQP